MLALFQPSLMLDTEVADCTEVISKITHWSGHCAQMASGSFRNRTRGIHTAELQLGHVTWTQPCELSVAPPPRTVVFALLRPITGPFIVDGQSIPGGCLASFNKEVDAFLGVAPGELWVVSIARPLLDRFSLLLLGRSLLELERGNLLWWQQEVTSRSIDEAILRPVLEAAFRDPAWFDAPGRHAEVERRVLEYILLNTVQKWAVPLSSTERVVRQVRELLLDQRDQPASISDLCQETQVPASSIHFAFHKLLGVAPKHYLKLHNLNGARRQMLSAPPGASVTDIAMAWNQFHLGRFSTEYRALFGESPRETRVRGLQAYG